MIVLETNSPSTTHRMKVWHCQTLLIDTNNIWIRNSCHLLLRVTCLLRICFAHQQLEALPRRETCYNVLPSFYNTCFVVFYRDGLRLQHTLYTTVIQCMGKQHQNFMNPSQLS
jgi:hypothetical protein